MTCKNMTTTCSFVNFLQNFKDHERKPWETDYIEDINTVLLAVISLLRQLFLLSYMLKVNSLNTNVNNFIMLRKFHLHVYLHLSLDSLSPFTLNCETPSMNSNNNEKKNTQVNNKINVITLNKQYMTNNDLSLIWFTNTQDQSFLTMVKFC